MRASVVASLALLGGACRGDEAERDGIVTTVDTAAGVVTVRSSGTAPVTRTSLRLRLGSRGGLQESARDEFGRIERVLTNARGDVLVADGLAHQIRVFDSAGSFVREIGRRGAGPGEIEGLLDIAWTGDSLLVMDPHNARLTLLTTAGEYVTQWPWARLSGTPVRFYEAGSDIYAWSMVDRGSGLTAAWVRYTESGPADTLPVVWRERRGHPPRGIRCIGDGIGFFDNPFATRLLATPAPDGLVAQAVSDGYRIAFTEPSGDTVRVVERPVGPVPLGDQEWAPVQARLERFRESWRGANCDGDVDRPEHLPILRSLGFASDGRLLVEVNKPDGPALDVYDDALAWQAQIPLPARDESVPLLIQAGRLHLVARDSLGVHRVEVYDLVPPSRGAGGT